MAMALFSRLEKDECIQATQSKAPGKTKGVNKEKTNEMLIKVQTIIESNNPQTIASKGQTRDLAQEQSKKEVPIPSKMDATKKTPNRPVQKEKAVSEASAQPKPKNSNHYGDNIESMLFCSYQYFLSNDFFYLLL